jgi:hypothetical protein
MAISLLTTIDEAVKEAVFNKFASILGLSSLNNDIEIWPKDVALRWIAEKRAEVQVEFINVYRRSDLLFDWKRNSSYVAQRGIPVSYTNPISREEITTYKGVPVPLPYDIWFWSHDRNKINEIIEVFLFWLFNNSKLEITLDSSIPLEFDIHTRDLVDETDVGAMFNKGLYHVLRGSILIDGWIFSSEEVKTVKEIQLKIYDEGPSGNILLFDKVFSCD